ncbi:MAG: VanW family protein [Patescibacteria group bacterium]|jgi:vancomycin resistance protein YoaR
MKKHQIEQLLLKIILIVFILLLPLNLIFFYSFLFYGRIYPNIYVNSLHLGGKNEEQAATKLLKQLEKRTRTLTLSSSIKDYYIHEADLKIQYDINQTVRTAYNLGRNSGFMANLLKRVQLVQKPHRLPLSVTIDESNFNSFVASVSAEVNEPAIPASVSIILQNGEKTASVSAGKNGRYVDEPLVKKQVYEAFATQNFSTIPLPIKVVSNNVTKEQLQEAQDTASKLLNKKLILEQDGYVWELTDEELINFLSVSSMYNNDKLAVWVGQLAKSVNRKPENALFEFDGQRVVEFKPAKPGITLLENETVEAIKTGIEALTQEETEYTVTLVTTSSEPEITTGKVNNLGIKELIGKGESWFSHSIASRIHNVSLAASKFHGVLIPPGETFSFVKTVGEIDAQHGYQPAYIIQNGRTILGDGGGVCQVSTTLFRAALDAGLEIVERSAHAYRVSYYEQNSSPGIDATVFSPSVDLKFKNDTPSHILIQAYVDQKNTYMKFELYGTSDGRKVTMTKPQIWDQVPPPPDVYQDDPTLPKDVVKQVDWKAWGAKTSFNWIVERDGYIIHEKTFYSNYRPWAAVFLRGTKEN